MTMLVFREKSEELRKEIKKRIDHALAEAKRNKHSVVITGTGDSRDKIGNAVNVLGGVGMVLIDLPIRKKAEHLHYYPEDFHRGQREDFDSPALLDVSQLWKLLSANLHEAAGSIRVFVHPDIDVLRSARTGSPARPLLDSETITDCLRVVFKEQ